MLATNRGKKEEDIKQSFRYSYLIIYDYFFNRCNWNGMLKLVIRGIFNDALTDYKDKESEAIIYVNEEEYERLSKLYPQDENN